MVGVYVGEVKKEKNNQWTLCWKCFTWMGVVFLGDGGGREGGAPNLLGGEGFVHHHEKHRPIGCLHLRVTL